MRVCVGLIVCVAMVTPAAPGASAETAWIMTDHANVRSAPSKMADVIAVAGIGIKGDVLDRSGDWVHLRLAESGVIAEGYVHASLLSLAVEVPVVPGKTRLTLVAVKVSREQAQPGERFAATGRASIRSRADAGSETIGTLAAGDEIALVSITRLPGGEAWASVRLGDGREGYVPLSAGKRVQPVPAAIVQENAELRRKAAEMEAEERARREAEEMMEAERETARAAWLRSVEEAQAARQAAERAQAIAEQSLREERERARKEVPLAFDYKFGLNVGGGSATHGTGASVDGMGVFAWKKTTGLWFQAAATLERTEDLRRYGASGGVGYEFAWHRYDWGAYVFADAMQWQLRPCDATSHVQVRPLMRWSKGRYTLAGYAGIPITQDQLASESVERRVMAAADGVHEITDTERIYDRALFYGGAELRADLTTNFTLAFRGEAAQGKAYRLGLAGEYNLGSSFLGRLVAEHTDYGDYPLLGQSGYGQGWSVRVGIAYGRAGGGALTGRLVIDPSWPLVVQRVEKLRRDEVVADSLAATAAASPPSGVAPLAVTLVAAATGGKPPYQYTWALGDGGSATGRTVLHVYSRRGDYTAVVSVRDSLGQTAGAQTAISVSDQPLSLSCSAAPTEGDAPLTVRFGATARGGSGKYAFAWNLGDGSASSDRNPTHVYKRAGTYTAVVTVSSGSESASCEQRIEVSSHGEPLTVQCSASGHGGPAPYTVALSAVAYGGTPPYSYKWETGDGATKYGDTVEHTYEAEEVYTATATVVDSRRKKATCSERITVTAQPPDLVLSCSATKTHVIAPDTVQFGVTATGGTGEYTYRWTFTDGGSSNEQNPAHRYECNPGTYRAIVTVTSGEQSESCEVTVIVENPSITLRCSATPDEGAAPLTVQFDVTVSGQYREEDTTYYWEFGDGEWSIDKSPSHVYSAPATYYAVVHVTAGCVGEECEVRVDVY